jgi:hypothetical protein
MKSLNDIEKQNERLFYMNSKNNIITNINRQNMVVSILNIYRANFYRLARIDEHYIDNTMLLYKRDYSRI